MPCWIDAGDAFHTKHTQAISFNEACHWDLEECASQEAQKFVVNPFTFLFARHDSFDIQEVPVQTGKTSVPVPVIYKNESIRPLRSSPIPLVWYCQFDVPPTCDSYTQIEAEYRSTTTIRRSNIYIGQSHTITKRVLVAVFFFSLAFIKGLRT